MGRKKKIHDETLQQKIKWVGEESGRHRREIPKQLANFKFPKEILNDPRYPQFNEEFARALFEELQWIYDLAYLSAVHAKLRLQGDSIEQKTVRLAAMIGLKSGRSDLKPTGKICSSITEDLGYTCLAAMEKQQIHALYETVYNKYHALGRFEHSLPGHAWIRLEALSYGLGLIKPDVEVYLLPARITTDQDYLRLTLAQQEMLMHIYRNPKAYAQGEFALVIPNPVVHQFNQEISDPSNVAARRSVLENRAAPENSDRPLLSFRQEVEVVQMDEFTPPFTPQTAEGSALQELDAAIADIREALGIPLGAAIEVSTPERAVPLTQSASEQPQCIDAITGFAATVELQDYVPEKEISAPMLISIQKRKRQELFAEKKQELAQQWTQTILEHQQRGEEFYLDVAQFKKAYFALAKKFYRDLELDRKPSKKLRYSPTEDELRTKLTEEDTRDCNALVSQWFAEALSELQNDPRLSSLKLVFPSAAQSTNTGEQLDSRRRDKKRVVPNGGTIMGYFSFMPAPKERGSPLEPCREKTVVPAKKKMKATAVIESRTEHSRRAGVNLHRLWGDEPNRPSFFVKKSVSRQNLPDSFHQEREEMLKRKGPK